MLTWKVGGVHGGLLERRWIFTIELKHFVQFILLCLCAALKFLNLENMNPTFFSIDRWAVSKRRCKYELLISCIPLFQHFTL